MILHQLLNGIYHPMLACFRLGIRIDGEILVNPYTTESFLVDSDHILSDFESPKPVIQSLKSNHRLF